MDVMTVETWLLSIRNIQTKWKIMEKLGEKSSPQWGVLYRFGRMKLVRIY